MPNLHYPQTSMPPNYAPAMPTPQVHMAPQMRPFSSSYMEPRLDQHQFVNNNMMPGANTMWVVIPPGQV